MLNKLWEFIRSRDMLAPGDRCVCAVSGGTDSVALLFALYLLREKLDIRLEAAHFNHNLRGQESCRDEQFVRSLCEGYDIPLHVGQGTVTAGKKGLEAAAREARYAYLRGLGGKVATAHTADDNAETVLMHLIRGTSLKGLGGIAPVNGNVIRPMLTVTRQETEDFLREWNLPHVEDSSNESDRFLRNRVRRGVMPLLKAENPRISQNLSRMALGLREDEACLTALARRDRLPPVSELKQMPRALRGRMLENFLKNAGVREPEENHIALAEELLFSHRPSAKADFPGGVTIARNYDCLEVLPKAREPEPVRLTCPGETVYGEYRVCCAPAEAIVNSPAIFTVVPRGELTVGPRRAGDVIRLSGGSKSLKKLFIDRKIPASQRGRIPVLRDTEGILGVYSVGVHQERAAADLPAVTVRFLKISDK